MVSDCEDGFPAGDWIGTDDGVRSFEVIANVVRRAARGRVQFEVIVFRSFIEQWLRIGGSKAFKELLVTWGDTVKYFVAGRPKGIWGKKY